MHFLWTSGLVTQWPHGLWFTAHRKQRIIPRAAACVSHTLLCRVPCASPCLKHSPRVATWNPFKIKSILALKMVLLLSTHHKIHLGYNPLSFFGEKMRLRDAFWERWNSVARTDLRSRRTVTQYECLATHRPWWLNDRWRYRGQSPVCGKSLACGGLTHLFSKIILHTAIHKIYV